MAADVVWILCVLFLGTGLALIHELGHAFAVVLLTGRRSLVTLGSGNRYAGLRLGRIRIRVLRPSSYAACELPPSASPRDLFIISLAGPAASFLTAVVLAIPLMNMDRPELSLLGLATFMALIEGIGNLVPFKNDDVASDGWLALRAWKDFRGTPYWRTPFERIWQQEVRPMACRPLLEATVEEARRSKTPYVGTEHLLIAVADSDGDAGRVLRAAGLSPARLRSLLPSHHDTGQAREPRNSPAIKRVYQAAPGHLSLRGDQEIAPEHLLLALLHERSGRALELVEALGSSPAALRSALVHAMARPVRLKQEAASLGR
jgi:hypothetical protein